MNQIYNNNCGLQNQQNKQKYCHLTLNERKIIKKYYEQNYSYQKIADKLGRAKSTIYNEIKRNGTMNQPSMQAKRRNTKRYRYSYKNAQKSYELRQNSKKISTNNKIIIELFNKNIVDYYSLNHFRWYIIKHHTKLEVPTLKTFYNWFHNKIITYKNKFKNLRKYRKKIKPAHRHKKSIHTRPFEMNDYSLDKHYEIDTIYDGTKKGGVLTLNNRSTMFLYAIIIPDRKPATINKNLRKLINIIGPSNIDSITSDNGVEFSYNLVIENYYNLNWYFADPYCSGQRGQNERLNRDIRMFYPKGTYFKDVSANEFNNNISNINNLPRDKFNGLSADEMKNILN